MWAINHKSSRSESLFSRLYSSLIQEHTMHRLGYASSRLLDGQYQVLHTHTAVALSHESNERPCKLTPREILIKCLLTLSKHTKTLIKSITPIIRAFFLLYINKSIRKYYRSFGLNTNTNREPCGAIWYSLMERAGRKTAFDLFIRANQTSWPGSAHWSSQRPHPRVSPRSPLTLTNNEWMHLFVTCCPCSCARKREKQGGRERERQRAQSKSSDLGLGSLAPCVRGFGL